MACVAPVFISRIEKWLDDFVKAGPSITRQDLPPLDRVQRQCVHELAKFYGIGTESQGSDARQARAISLTRRRDTKTPSVSLTNVANITGIFDSKRSSSDDALKEPSVLETAPSSTLHIYDLHKGILTNTLNSFLSGFPNEYTLQWIDDENCLAIFSDPLRMQRALNSLQPRGTFKVKAYQDALPDSFGSGLISLGSGSTSSSPSAAWAAANGSTSWSAPAANPGALSTASFLAPKVKVAEDGSYKPQSVWNRGPPSASSPSATNSINNVHTGSNLWDVLGTAETAPPGLGPAHASQSSNSSSVVSQSSLMMWNYGEDDKAKKTTETHASSAEASIASPAAPVEPRQQAHVVDNWETAEDEEEAPVASTAHN